MNRLRLSTRKQSLRKRFFKQEPGRRLQLERLEDRLALATVELTLVGTTLTLTGDKDAVPAEINDRVVVDYDAGTNVYTFIPETGTTLTDPGAVTTPGGGGLQIDGSLLDTLNITLLTGDDQATVLSAGSSDTISFDGGTGLNRLTGPNSDALWSIADTDQGQLAFDQGAGAVQIGFTQVQLLDGGAAADTFDVAAGKSLSAGGITGGGGANTLTIDDAALAAGTTYQITSTDVTRNGVVVLAYSGLQTLTLNAGTGSDTVLVASTGAETTINGGAGNDTITIAAAAHATTVLGGAGADTIAAGTGILNTITAAIIVDGETDADTLTVNDSADFGDNTYTINANQVTRGGVTVTYTAIEDLFVKTGAGEDDVTITATGATTTVESNGGDDSVSVLSISDATTLRTGAGEDLVTLGTGTLDTFAALITVEGGGDEDSLLLQDAADITTNNTYTITANQVTRPAFIVDYSQVETLTVNAGTGGDTIQVDSTSAVTTVNAGAGNDGITVGNGTLNNIAHTVTVAGDAGDDSLTVNDSTNAGSNTYLITAAQVTRGGVTINYSTVESLTLLAGTGVDQIFVGDGTLDNMVPTITVNGGSVGSPDSLTVNDSTDNTGNTYTISDAQITRGDGTTINTTINYNQIENLTLNAGTGGDTIQVDSTGAVTTVNAGAGIDGITVGNGTLNNIAHTVTVAGDAGADSLTVNDAANTGSNTYNISATQVTRGGVTINYSTVESLTLLAGTGADQIFVGDGTLDNMVPSITVNGGSVGSPDSLTVNDSADADANSYNITAAQVTRVGVTINYSTVEILTLLAGTGADQIFVGDGTLDNMVPSITVNGGSVGSPDRLTVNDSADASDNTYNISAMQVTRSDGITNVTINYSQIENLTLQSGSGDDTVVVASTGATTLVQTAVGEDAISVLANGHQATVQAGADNDAVTVGNGTLDGIGALVSVDGGTQSDSLTIDDAGNANNNTYNITPTQVTRAGVTINYTQIENLNLLAGMGHDVVTLFATGAATLIQGGIGNDTISIHATTHFVRAEGNEGNDTFHAGNGTLNNLLVAPTFVGSETGESLSREIRQGGAARNGLPYFRPRLEVVSTADKLILEDGSNGGNARYEIFPSMATRNGVRRATFSEMEVLKLQAGMGNDDVVVRMYQAYRLPDIVQVDGGGGNDNRFQVEGTGASDNISIGDMDSALLGAMFELNQVERLWARGGAGNDVIDNISRTPGLMDGGIGDDLLNAIISTPPKQSGGVQTTTILLGAEGRDKLFAGSGALLDNRIIGFRDATGVDAGVPLAAYPDQGIVFVTGDYRLQSPFGNRPLRAVGGGGTAGDQYASSSAVSKHGVLALRDNQTNAIRGRFQTIGGDKLRTSSIIGWLKAELRITKNQLTKLLGQLNRQVAEYTKSPGAGPSASIRQFTPRNINGK